MNTYGTPRWQKAQPVGSAIAATASGVVDNLNKEDNYGRKKAGLAALSKGMEMGAAGAQFGPIGAGVGAVVGAAIGFFTQRKANREGDFAEFTDRSNQLQSDTMRSANQYASMQYGSSYVKHGGPLGVRTTSSKKVGGILKQLNSNTQQAEGNTHAQGGIYLDEYGAEIEDEETIYHSPEGPYVFSDFLQPNNKVTYAEQDSKLAKALGKLEKKPSDILTKTAMQMLEKQRMKNMKQQELHRKMYEEQLLNEQP